MGELVSRLFERFFDKHDDYFSEEHLACYSECTYFSQREINKLYKKFQALNPQKLDAGVGDVRTRLTFDEVVSLSDLRQCPFSFRLCQVFSTDSVGISFEDFLDMMSVFSHRAPWNLKAAYAFRIFDFNEDSRICFGDIETAIRYLTDGGHGIEDNEMKKIVKLVSKEIEAGDSDFLTYTEFEHMIATAPDFIRFFRIPIV